MGFLDNLESNLKSLESREEGKDDAERQRRARVHDRANALATAPWAEPLKKGPYTADLLKTVSRLGHELRVKVHLAWLGDTLRLEARERRLELRPTREGIVAVPIVDGREGTPEPVDLNGSPENLLRHWLEAPR
jgi:hypothetical protein